MKQERVEILKVFLPSPPVPTISMVSSPSRSILTQSSSKASRKPCSSSMVMLRIRKTVIKAAISLSLYSPRAILVSTSLACSRVSVLCSNKYCKIFFISLRFQPVFHQLFALGREHTLRMELHPLNIQGLMPEAHDIVVVVAGRHLQDFG